MTLYADHIAGAVNVVPDLLSRDRWNDVPLECEKEGIPPPTILAPCAIWEGYMEQAIVVVESLERDEGDWVVEEMKSALEESDQAVEGLEGNLHTDAAAAGEEAWGIALDEP